MTDNIHRHLDGELPREAITPDETEALREFEEAIFIACSWVEATPVPAMADRVMAALPEAADAHAPEAVRSPADQVQAPVTPARSWRKTRLADVLSWALTPRPFALRPATVGLFGVFALLAIGRFAQPDPATLAPVAVTGDVVSDPTPVFIQFRLDTATASEVALAGTFTEWQPDYVLHESAPGVWTVTVPLQPGVHDYLFVVDGNRWVPDPAATTVDDGFGGTNSRLLLSAPIQGA